MISFALFSFVGCCVGNPPNAVPNWRIEGTHVGPIQIGMTIAEFRRAAHVEGIRVRPAAWMAMDTKVHGFDLYSGQTRLMRIDPDKGRIGFIDVYDPRFSTVSGIHTGLTLRDAVKAYGKGNVDAGDNTVELSFDKKLPTISFILSDSDHLPGEVTLGNLPKHTPRIISVSIHRSML